MRLQPRQYVIMLLILLTSALHFGAALDHQLFPEGPDPLFLLNGLGYLGLFGCLFPPHPHLSGQAQARWRVLIGYVILTIVAWLIIWVGINVIGNHVPFFSRDLLYGVPAKISEVILPILLRQDKPQN